MDNKKMRKELGGDEYLPKWLKEVVEAVKERKLTKDHILLCVESGDYYYMRYMTIQMIAGGNEETLISLADVCLPIAKDEFPQLFEEKKNG